MTYRVSVLSLLFVAGCGLTDIFEEAPARSVGSDDFETLWTACVRAVRHDFVIDAQDKESGLIETLGRVERAEDAGSRTGSFNTTIATRVQVRVNPAEGSFVATVRAFEQRETSTAHESCRGEPDESRDRARVGVSAFRDSSPRNRELELRVLGSIMRELGFLAKRP